MSSGGLLSTVLGFGSSMYASKQQSKIQKENLKLQQESLAMQKDANAKAAAQQELETKRATSENELETKRLQLTENKRRQSIFQRSNYGNETFGQNILG